MTLKPNWIYVIFCLFTWIAMCVFIGWMATVQNFNAAQKGLPAPDTWSWAFVIGLDILCLVAILWFLRKIYCDLKTEITDDYISQPHLFGRLRYDWDQVKKITTFGYGIHIHGQRGKIVLTPYAYKNPKDVITKISEMIERKLISH